MNNQLLDKLVRQAVAATPDVTDATIAAALVADCRTPQPIPLGDLQVWLAQGGRTARLRRTLASPVLAAVLAGAGLPVQQTTDELADAIGYFGSPHNEQLDTQDAAIGAKVVGLLQVMRGVNMQDASLGMAAAEVGQFLALGGGVTWGPGSVQAADVAASRVRLARAAEAEALRVRVLNAAAAFVNEVLAVAEADPKAALPTWADYYGGLSRS